jgi:hypothetical protein
VLCSGGVAVWLIASWFIMPMGYDTHLPVLFIRFKGYVAQVVVSTLAAWGAVVGAVSIGRRGQRAADARQTAADSPSRILSTMYATFKVGENEVHEVGVLCTGFGRVICTVDGEKKLDARSLAPRGSRGLTVGNDERHDITIQWRFLPLWSVRGFVDGECLVEELFPDGRLLFNVMVTVTMFLIALLFASILVLLSMVA